jgi:hypothetical protein
MKRVWALALVIAFSGSIAAAAAPATATADFSGRWLPVPALSTPWPDPLPLTDAARKRLAAFEPDRDEPAGFCMPLGTPRNTLAGASPLEVLQTADRVYFIFQPNLLNAETRRVYLDGRPQPPAEDRVPTWLGSSRGHWASGVLVVDTVGIEPQALIDGNGLSQGGKLHVRERWRLGRDAKRGRVLQVDLTLEDPDSFTVPLKTRRVFAWAPDAQLAEGQCSERLWIDGLWRYRLGEHAAAARDGKARATPDRVRAAGDKP